MVQASSRYKQVRLTVSELENGAISARILVKPVEGTWNYRHSVWHHVWKTTAPTPHWLDLLAQVYAHLGMETFPPDQ